MGGERGQDGRRGVEAGVEGEVDGFEMDEGLSRLQGFSMEDEGLPRGASTPCASTSASPSPSPWVGSMDGVSSSVFEGYEGGAGYLPPGQQHGGRGRGRGKGRVQGRTRNRGGNESRTVVVGDLDANVKVSDVLDHFAPVGTPVDCRMCVDSESGARLAFVEFGSAEEVNGALSMSGSLLGFSPIRVRRSRTQIEPVNRAYLPKNDEENEMRDRTVYVANIDKHVKLREVRGLFESLCGTVERSRLVGDKDHPTRIAFVQFASLESAAVALHCSGARLGNLTIRVTPSKTPVRAVSDRQAAPPRSGTTFPGGQRQQGRQAHGRGGDRRGKAPVGRQDPLPPQAHVAAPPPPSFQEDSFPALGGQPASTSTRHDVGAQGASAHPAWGATGAHRTAPEDG